MKISFETFESDFGSKREIILTEEKDDLNTIALSLADIINFSGYDKDKLITEIIQSLVEFHSFDCKKFVKKYEHFFK